MTAKDTLVDVLRDEGWDFISASEHAQKFLDEFRDSPARKTTVHTKTRSFVLTKIGPFCNCDPQPEGENP